MPFATRKAKKFTKENKIRGSIVTSDLVLNGGGYTFFLPFQTNGISQFPSSLTINSVVKTPSHRWNFANATSTQCADYIGSATLAVSGSGTAYTTGVSTLFIDNSTGVQFNAGKNLAAQSTEAVTFGTDDFLINIVLSIPMGSSADGVILGKGNLTGNNRGFSIKVASSGQFTYSIANGSASKIGTFGSLGHTSSTFSDIAKNGLIHLTIGCNRSGATTAEILRCCANGSIGAASSSSGTILSTDSLDDGVSAWQIGNILKSHQVVFCEIYKGASMWDDSTFSTQFSNASLELFQRVSGFYPQVAAGSPLYTTSFSRSLSVATSQKGTSYYIATQNWPRIVTDTAGFTGFLAEQNNSQSFDDNVAMAAVSWVKLNATTAVSSTVDSPIKGFKAIEFIDDATLGQHSCTQVVTTSTVAIQSVMVKAGTKSWLKIGATVGGTNVFAYFNASTGNFGTVGSGVISTFKETLSDGWYRIGIRQSSSGSTTCQLLIADGDGVDTYSGSGTAALYLMVPMFETGTTALRHPTSPCLNPSTSATSRNIDVSGAWSATSNLAGAGTAVDATLQIECKMYDADVIDSGSLLIINDGTNNNRLQVIETSSDQAEFLVTTGGVAQATITGADDLSDGNIHSIKFSVQTNDFRAYIDGALVGSDSSGTAPIVTTIRIGSTSTTSSTEGKIRNVIFRERSLP